MWQKWGTCHDNSLVQVRHLRSDAYSAEQVSVNKQQIWGGAPKLDCYPCHIGKFFLESAWKELSKENFSKVYTLQSFTQKFFCKQATAVVYKQIALNQSEHFVCESFFTK